MKIIRILTLAFCSCTFLFANAQQKDIAAYFDSSFLPTSFYKTFENGLPIHNGRLFQSYAPSIKGTPYYPETGWGTGTIKYENIWYRNQKLLFDAVAGDIILEAAQKLPVILFNERVSAFVLDGKPFINLGPQVSKNLPKGFYEVLLSGDYSLIALRKKIIFETLGQTVVEREFQPAYSYFINNGGTFHSVPNRAALLAINKIKKGEIKRALKKANLRFKSNTVETILLATQILNQH